MTQLEQVVSPPFDLTRRGGICVRGHDISSAEAQHAEKIYRLGFLANVPLPFDMGLHNWPLVDGTGRPGFEVDVAVERKKFPSSHRKTAKALGLTIPPSLLLRADQVIE